MRFLTKKDAVAERLRQEIMRGALRPGDQLEQDQIAARLNVSATPVREALSVLEAEGLLDARPHRGAVVARVDPVRAQELYELRYVLEMSAMRRTLRRPIDKHVLAALERIAKQGESAASKPDLHRLRATQARFHERLVESCGSQIWAETTKHLISRSLFLVPMSPPRVRRITLEHRAILAALKRGDTRLAERRMDGHLQETLKALAKHARSQSASDLAVGEPAAPGGRNLRKDRAIATGPAVRPPRAAAGGRRAQR